MIDRIKPKFLSSDQDERLGAEGMMTEALNVSISNYDEGDEGVIKNMKSNVEIEPATGEGVGDDCTVIGKVADPAAGRVYFFVASDTASESGIYYINVGDAPDEGSVKYNRLITNSLFNFSQNSFVKADIIKGTFLSSTSEQTVIYFTDDVNPPRKINVERVAEDVYNTAATDRFDRAVSVIKGASNNAPTVNLGTDTSRDINNINDNLFQFATQIVYNDGEESAVSPYSKIAVSRPTYLNALEEAGYGVLNSLDNYIDVSHNIEFYSIPDINKIRILCRASNSASWFIAEEYDPKVGVSAQVAGSQTELAAPNSNTYRFYADTLGSLVSPTVFNKQYDNVPLRASGQSIVRNRLMYSDYVEGFENVDATAFPLTASYQDESSGNTEYITSSEQASIFGTTASNTQITIDLAQAAAFNDDTDDVPAGTKGVFSFEYSPQLTLSNSSTIFTAKFRESTSTYEYIYHDGELILSSSLQQQDRYEAEWDTLVLDDYSLNDPINISIVTGQDTDGDVGDFMEGILTSIQGGSISPVDAEYSSDGVAFSNIVRYYSFPSNTDPITLTDVPDCKFKVTFSFDDAELNGTVLTIKPYISDVRLIGGTAYPTSTGTFTIYKPLDSEQTFVSSDEQSDLTYAASSNPTAEFVAEMTSVNIVSSLKAGSNHSFGIVYYDKFGRHGFVNPIGSVDIDYPAKRGSEPHAGTPTKTGSALASIEFFDKNNGNHIDVPSWSDSWQIVLSEPNTIFDSFSYTVGGAFVPVNDDGTVDVKKQQIYVSLKNLQQYRDEKGVVRDYSFTEGDKLRVVSHRSFDDSKTVYPTSNQHADFGGDGAYDEREAIVEFDVVGYEILSGDDAESNPLMGVTGSAATYSNAQKEKYDGAFLVLESSQINSGVEVTVSHSDATHPLMYWGFDWQSIAKWQQTNGITNDTTATISYNNGSSTEMDIVGGQNRWYRETVVDIVSPRKRTSEQIYYEVGVGGKTNTAFAAGSTAGNNHGVRFITVGDSNYYLRPVACKTPVYDSGWNYDTPKEWEYKTLFLEDESVTDRIVSNSWNKGKAHVIYEKAKEVRRPYSVTWSDAYNVDVETLTLSSFNASQINYANYAAKYGSLTYIDNYDENLLALQENKASIVPIEKAVLNQAAGGDGVVSLSSAVLNEGAINYYAGDWGCNLNPESVLIYDTQVFFADASRGKVIRITREGLSAISDKGLSRLLDGKFQNVSYSAQTQKVLSGFDPDDQYYYITIKSDSATNTYAYDVRSGVWVSEASFIPDMYAHLDNEMYTFKYVSSGDKLVWRHSFTDRRNQFYGTNYDSKITVYSKFDPSMVKIYKAVGLNYQRINNSGSLPDIRLVSSEGNDTGDGVMAGSSLQEREGQWYREVPGDTSGSDAQHYFGIGNGVSASGTTLTMSNLRNARVPIGGKIYYMDGNDLEGAQASGPLVTVSSVDYSTNTITASGALNSAISNADIIIVTDESANGARIRGRYCKVTLDMSTILPWELYSIDMNFENSRPNYALGQ